MLFNTIAFAKFFAVVFTGAWLLSSWPRARFIWLATWSYVFYSGIDLLTVDLYRGFFAALRGVDELGIPHGTDWRAALVFLGKRAPYWKFVPIVFIGSTVDYYLSIFIARAKTDAGRKHLLYITIAMNTGLLLVFKYWDFLAEQVIALGGPDKRLHLPLPIGISFFTFMSLSYVVDVYRREIEPCRDYRHYVTYIAFFPHLVAGPIIRGKDLLPLFAKRAVLTSATAGEGIFLACIGLFKKVVVSDYLAVNLVDRVVLEPSRYSSLEVLVGMFGYAIQIYCDFSGYSDVAIGVALLLGYRLKINFDAPFKSSNLVEFWRRWHISLSSWLRDYVYIPLGGSRRGRWRKYANVWITMVVCGIWHGAAWSYVLFGMIQGTAVGLTHAYFDSRGKRPSDAGDNGIGSDPVRWIAVLVTFVFTTLTFVLIRAPLHTALLMYKQLFQLTLFVPNVSWKILLLIGGGLVVQWVPKRWYERAKTEFIEAPSYGQATVLFLLALALRQASVSEAVPFVYGQF